MYRCFNDFVLRTPLCYFDCVRDNWIVKVQDKLVLESIYLASPILYDELCKLLDGSIDKGKEYNRIRYSIERYLCRMMTRCTPFGLFAGCSIGEIGSETSIQVDNSLKRKTRLDMYYLSLLYNTLLRHSSISESIYYYPNNSLYHLKHKYRYVECFHTDGNRKYQLQEIDSTSYLNKILKLSSNGIKLNELIASLVCDEITNEEARHYVHELINSQILVGELYQSLTGDDYFKRVISLLESTNCEVSLLNNLKGLKRRLDSMDLNESVEISTYAEIINNIKLINVPYEKQYLFQVDMVKNLSQSILGEKVIVELKSTMEFLNKLTPLRQNEVLKKFQEDFFYRYEEREVPLMEVLDPELGLGYPSKSMDGDEAPLIEELELPFLKNTLGNASMSSLEILLLGKMIETLTNGGKEIVLIDKDIDGNPNWDDLPSTMYTMFNMIRSEKNGLLIQANFFSGSCGAILLSRFAHVDERIKEFVKKIACKEQQLSPDSILAELVYLPESRTGNILMRPHIREYELAYMSDSDLPKDKMLYVSDLLLSVRNGKLHLRSKRLNKEIVPRLTNAHNFRNHSMPVYRFLCDMQHPYGRNSLFFNWGILEKQLPFRPRVRYKNTILSLASWNIKVVDIKYLFKIADEALLLDEIIRWRTQISLPVYVVMPDGDNELFIDWGDFVSVKSLFTIIKHRDIISLKEFIFEPENAVVKGENGVYVNECIVAFYKS